MFGMFKNISRRDFCKCCGSIALSTFFINFAKANSEKNQLISMDGSKFNLSSKNAVDLTDEVISLVSRMYFGKKEYNEFKELNENK